MRIFVAALAAAGCLAGAGASEAAQLYKATFTGHIVPGGYDLANVFGLGAGFTVLEGQTVTASFIYDPTLGNVVNLGPNAEGRRGGLIPFNNVGPIVDAFLTINNITIEFTPEQRSEIRNISNIYQWSLQDQVAPGPGYNDFAVNLNFPGSTGHLTDTRPAGAATGAGLFTIRDSQGLQRANANFTLSEAAITTYTPRAAVPEPASWALLIAGFGGVGAVLRQRRRSAALAA